VSFKPPEGPQKVSVAKIRLFDGVWEQDEKVLRRTNYKGWDVSNTIANEVEDVTCGERGSLILRPGMRKIDDTGKTETIEAIFYAGMTEHYGIIYGGILDMIEVPRKVYPRKDKITLTPASSFAAVASDSPEYAPEAY